MNWTKKHALALSNSVEYFEKKKLRFSLGELILTLFTGWVIGILTMLLLLEEVMPMK